MCVYAQLLSFIQLFVTLWTVALLGSAVYGILGQKIMEYTKFHKFPL